MQTPRLFPHSQWLRAAALTLCLILLAALAGCDEKTPTDAQPVSPDLDVTAVASTEGVSALAIQLPVNQQVATTAPAPAFRVQQTGSGPDGIFQISNSANIQPALQGVTSGRGRAGFFRIANAANTRAALDVETNGSGFAVQGIATGNGTAGAFRVSLTGNTKAALVARTAGSGPAGLFETTNIDNPSPILVARNVGTGHAIDAITNNDGDFVEAVARIEALHNGDGLWLTARGSNYNALVVRGRSELGGNVHVAGTLTKNAGSFKIDHPLDPGRKYLSHSFVESPDMMNVYNGNVTLDANGRATVKLPEYFEALNRDFRYQLTAVGAPGPNLYIAEGVKQNRFQIAGGRAYAHVSWQVTGVRQDAYAEQHRIKVEEDKPPAEDLVARR